MQEVIVVSMYVGENTKILAGTAQILLTGDNTRDTAGAVAAQNALINSLVTFDFSTAFDYTSLCIDNLTESEVVQLAQKLHAQLNKLPDKEEYLQILLDRLESIGFEEESEVSLQERYTGIIEELYEIGVLV